MEGVIVSARAADRSFTTSVFTDRQGNYTFPSLDAGQYKVWAQAVGFEAGRSEFALAGARVERNLTLTALKDSESDREADVRCRVPREPAAEHGCRPPNGARIQEQLHRVPYGELSAAEPVGCARGGASSSI